MIRTFCCAEPERLFKGQRSTKFQSIERAAVRKLEILDAAVNLSALAAVPGNRLEKLKGDRTGQHSIRINYQWRICFEWRDSEAYEVEIVDYH